MRIQPRGAKVVSNQRNPVEPRARHSISVEHVRHARVVERVVVYVRLERQGLPEERHLVA